MSKINSDKDTAQDCPGVIQAAKTESPDPFSNIEELRVSQDHIEAVGLKNKLLTVPVRKPSKEWFVRVHPDPAYRFETAVIEFKEEGEIYLVDKSLWPELLGEPTFHFKAFFTAQNADKPEIHGGFARAYSVGGPEVVEMCKKLKVTARCIPLDAQDEPGTCLFNELS